jgi:hypothetical protein
MKKKFWTDEEVAYMRLVYPDSYSGDIAISLGRTVSQVYNKAAALGLNKSAAFFQKELKIQGDRLQVVGAGTRLKGGYNKGQKVSAETYEKIKQTMFQKGSLPKNTQYDGHERITKDGYIMIRIRKGKYVLKHKNEWEKVNGPIQAGHCLKCIDGNIKNTVPENWKLISRGENMLQNSIYRFPPELTRTIKVLAKLKRKINEK